LPFIRKGKKYHVYPVNPVKGIKLSKGVLSMSKNVLKKIKRWVEAPKSTQIMPDAPAVLGVILTFGEEVEWIWTHTDKGSYVSGYNIVNKPRRSI
jgi:hypothetical protein